MAEHISSEQETFVTSPQTDFMLPTQGAKMANTSQDSNTFKAGMRIWLDVAVMIFMFMFSQALGSVVTMLFGVKYPDETLLQSFDIDIKEQVAFMQARYIAVSYLISMVICLVLLWGYKRLRHLPIQLEFRVPGWASPFRLLCGYLLLWVFTIALEPLTTILPGDQSNMGSGGWLLVSAVILAPIFEEIFFRGYLTGLLQKTSGVIIAWLVSALLFAVIHGIPSVIATAFFSGLILSFYYIRYRSLVMVILLHSMNNVTACFLNTINMSDVTLYELLGDSTLYWSIYGLSLIVAIISLIRMFKILQSTKK